MRIVVLILAAILTACAAAATAGDEPAPAAPTPAPPAPPITTSKGFQNTAWMASVRAFAQGRGMKTSEQGQGAVRFLLLGGADPGDTKRAATLATQTLEHLEVWTGVQETFISKAPEPGEVFWLVVMPDGGAVAAFVDHQRAAGMMGPHVGEGEDLTKKLLAFPGPRMFFTYQEKVSRSLDEWAVYSTACMATDAFYRARDAKRFAPTWLREGLASQLQQLLCKRILCTTISYEDKAFPMSDNWSTDVAKLIRAGDKQATTASELMRMGLDALANVHYQQMWSLCTFLREAAGTVKGEKNRLRRIMDLTATGTSSEDAVKQVFGKGDPQLTKAWRTWAATAK